jgi:hypothetical protein
MDRRGSLGQGSLIVDVSAWDSTTVPGTWMVANLPGTSAATGGAFSIAEGELTLQVTAGSRPGEPARVRWWPGTDYDFFTATFATGHPDSTARARRTDFFPETKRLRMEGRIPAGSVDTIRLAQREPGPGGVRSPLRALERRGIQVQEGLRISWDAGDPVGPGVCVTGRPRPDGPVSATFLPDCPGAFRLAGLSSPPMAEIVKAIWSPARTG